MSRQNPLIRFRCQPMACAVAMASLSGLAQAAGISEEVVVTASRTEKPLSTIPNTVTVISKEELHQQISINNDLSTLMGNLVPGFSPSRQKLTSSGETLRGRSPLYLIDGVPQSNPLRDGSRDGHTIDPVMLERIEVIHGANAIHGLGASGGIINLITKVPTEETTQVLSVDMTTQGENSDSLSYGGSYSISGRMGQWDGMASFSYRDTGIFYDAEGEVIGMDTTQGDLMDTESYDGFVKLGYTWEQQRLQFTANHYNIEGSNDWESVSGNLETGTPTTAAKGVLPGDPSGNEVTTLSLQYTHDALLDQQLQAQLFRQEFAGTFGGGSFGTFQDPAFGPFGELFDQSENQSEKLGLKLTLAKEEIAGLPLNLVYGIDVFNDETRQELIQTGRNWVPDTRYENYAPFAQLEFSGLSNTVITAGVRREESTLEVDDYRVLASYGGHLVAGGNPDFSETLYNLGFTYQITEPLRLFANYSEGFSMPDVGRVLRGIDEAGQSVATFLALEPIITDNREVGIGYNSGLFQAQISYYASDSDFGQRLARGADGIFSVNREKTEISGIEASLDWAVSENDSLGLRYSRSEGEYDSDKDNRVDTELSGANLAPERLNATWEHQWSDTISTRLQASHLFSRDFDDRAGERYAQFDGYTTVDFVASVEMLSGSLNLSVQNLTDRDYFTYYSQTEGNKDRNFKGLGRSFSVGYSYRF